MGNAIMNNVSFNKIRKTLLLIVLVFMVPIFLTNCSFETNGNNNQIVESKIIYGESVLITNTGINADKNVATTITRDNLSIEVKNSLPEMTNNVQKIVTFNESSDPKRIYYKIKEYPKFGELKLVGRSTYSDRKAWDFTQADIDNGFLVYTCTEKSLVDDYFTFQAAAFIGTGENACLNWVAEQNFEFRIPSPPQIMHNSGAQIYIGETQTINGDILKITDKHTPDSELKIKITSLPTQGVLMLDNKKVNLNQVFLQKKMTAGNLTYAHNGDNYQQDSFGFEVFDELDYILENQLFTIGIIADPPIIIINQALKLRRNQTRTITADLLHATSDTAEDKILVFTVIKTPTHGQLRRNGVSLRNGDTFTQSDISKSLISYRHYGNNLLGDSFEFEVSDGNRSSDMMKFTILLYAN